MRALPLTGPVMTLPVNPLVDAVAASPFAAIAAEARPTPDKPLIDVGGGEPDYPPASELRAHLAARIEAPETARYTDLAGIAPLREALAAETRRLYGGDVGADDILVTAGCNQAFAAAMMALAGPGDAVVMPVPAYFNHLMWLAMLGIERALFPVRFERGALPEVADAEARVGARTRAIALVAPNNPTGAIYPPALIEAFCDLAAGRGIALVIDETYRDFVPGGGPPHHLFRRADWRETFVHLYSFSKVFALTGYRVGALVCGPRLRPSVAKVLDCIAICAPRIGQEAALYGLTHLAAWKAEKQALIGARTAALEQAFRRNDLTYELIAAGPFFAYVRHPFDGTPGIEVAKRLARDHALLTMPGSAFGPGQEAYLRLAYANLGSEWMAEIVARLAASQG